MAQHQSNGNQQTSGEDQQPTNPTYDGKGSEAQARRSHPPSEGARPSDPGKNCHPPHQEEAVPSGLCAYNRDEEETDPYEGEEGKMGGESDFVDAYASDSAFKQEEKLRGSRPPSPQITGRKQKAAKATKKAPVSK